MKSTELTIGADSPLSMGQAINHDKLNRTGFASSVVKALDNINATNGFVVSIEGAWGSGKTSTLAMIEELLSKKVQVPIIVNFNPWLVGDRDALLSLFLEKIATAVKLTDHAKSGRKAAKEIKSYAKAFDVIKLIPGAEPWASIVKSVISSVGEATGNISELKTLDIESQKNRVAEALRKISQPIIVFIDDLDRLFPQEVFEMIRIIKAVGDLPNVGYVLAWDAKYVQLALDSASVPQSNAYLDKIVQVRMPLPSLSISAKESLINEALDSLPKEALINYFPNSKNRISSLYFSGLRELLEQPRDVTRLFNTIALIEPALRGEIVLADIIGLAAIMVKAPSVFELMQKNPRWFVGRLLNDNGIEEAEDILKQGKENRDAAYQQCGAPSAIREIIYFLFPQLAEIEDVLSIGGASEIDGNLGAPGRLLVALQLSISAGDISFISAKNYLLSPSSRPAISATLTLKNCLEFLEILGDIAKSMNNSEITNVEETCISITRLVDQEPFISREKQGSNFVLHPAMVAKNSVIQLIANTNEITTSIPNRIVQDSDSLTVATRIMAHSYLSSTEHSNERELHLPSEKRSEFIKIFALNILNAAKKKQLLKISDPCSAMICLARLSPQSCPEVFAAIRENDPSLDSFALEILRKDVYSYEGQSYAIPKDSAVLEAYCQIETLRTHAQERLCDPELEYPAKAAWRSLTENKPIYGKDGSTSDD